MKKLYIVISSLGFFYQTVKCGKSAQELDFRLDSFSFSPVSRDSISTLAQENDSRGTSSISPMRQVSQESVNIKELSTLIDEFNAKDKTSDEISKFLDELHYLLIR